MSSKDNQGRQQGQKADQNQQTQGGGQGDRQQRGGQGKGSNEGGGGQGRAGNFIQTGPVDEAGNIIEQERGQGEAAQPSRDKRVFKLTQGVRVRTSEGVANFWFVEHGQDGQGRAIALENELSGRTMTLPPGTEVYLCAVYGKTDTFMVGIKFPDSDRIQGAVMRRMSVEHITGPDVLPPRKEADPRSQRNQGAGQSAARSGSDNQGAGQQRPDQTLIEKLVDQKVEEKLSQLGLTPDPDVEGEGEGKEIKISNFEEEPSVGV